MRCNYLFRGVIVPSLLTFSLLLVSLLPVRTANAAAAGPLPNPF